MRKVFFPRVWEMETEIGICFPFHVVVFFSSKFFSWTQSDSKSNTAQSLKSFCRLVYLILKESSLPKGISRV